MTTHRSTDSKIVAQQLGQSEHVLWIPAGYLQGHLHHQCHRITEQCYSKSHSTTKGLSHREICFEGGLPGNHGCIEEVDDADQELETRFKSVYYFVW